MPDLINQPSAMPTRKVTAAALAGALATVIVGSFQAFAAVQFPPGFESALAVLVMAATGWWVKDRAP